MDNIEISPYDNLLVYKKHYTPEIVYSIINEKKLSGLRIFAQLEPDRLTDLNFLKNYSFLESLDITSIDDYDFSFLRELENLKALSITTLGKNKIDLSNQINLESLALVWRKGKILGIEKCRNINELCLINFNEKDFDSIKTLENLKELKIKSASVTSMDGVENFTALKKLELGVCRKLEDLTSMTGLKNLTFLSFDTCPKIKDFEKIGSLQNLDDLEISDCKEINSIEFIQHLTSLKKLSLLGNTVIADGNLIPAKRIDQVFHKHYTHYNVEIVNQEFQDLIKRNIEKIKSIFK